MNVILLQRIEKLGIIGDVVSVKPGYARNFLLPQRKALRATKENISVFEAQKAQIEANNLQEKAEAEKVADRMKGTSITVIRQASEMGSLYGSVTTRDLAEGLTEEGFKVQKAQVVLSDVIKNLGLHKAFITLHPEVSVEIEANVARSKEEAELQAKGLSADGTPEEEGDNLISEDEQAEQTEDTVVEQDIAVDA